ncbi:hypothetical protein [Acidiphilium sp. C61]|uniref:hypothetical protein n=1 Tax=Acidiphilium sp. C61 TaxID=1671485 RepID=UPI001F1C7FAF|nr:hypothetical protein [Acidiphilium sp. C61]
MPTCSSAVVTAGTDRLTHPLFKARGFLRQLLPLLRQRRPLLGKAVQRPLHRRLLLLDDLHQP